MNTYEFNASYWRRLVAFLLDLFFVDFFLFGSWDTLLIKKFGGYEAMIQSVTSSNKAIMFLYVLMFCLMLIILCYFTIFTWLFQQTIGMMIMKIKVVSLQEKLTGWQSLIRNLILVPFFPVSLLWAIDPIHLFFSSEGQRWTEKLSKTKVVQTFRLQKV